MLTKEFMMKCDEFVLGEYNQTNVRQRCFLDVLNSSFVAGTHMYALLASGVRTTQSALVREYDARLQSCGCQRRS